MFFNEYSEFHIEVLDNNHLEDLNASKFNLRYNLSNKNQILLFGLLNPLILKGLLDNIYIKYKKFMYIL